MQKCKENIITDRIFRTWCQKCWGCGNSERWSRGNSKPLSSLRMRDTEENRVPQDLVGKLNLIFCYKLLTSYKLDPKKKSFVQIPWRGTKARSSYSLHFLIARWQIAIYDAMNSKLYCFMLFAIICVHHILSFFGRRSQTVFASTVHCILLRFSSSAFIRARTDE